MHGALVPGVRGKIHTVDEIIYIWCENVYFSRQAYCLLEIWAYGCDCDYVNAVPTAHGGGGRNHLETAQAILRWHSLSSVLLELPRNVQCGIWVQPRGRGARAVCERQPCTQRLSDCSESVSFTALFVLWWNQFVVCEISCHGGWNSLIHALAIVGKYLVCKMFRMYTVKI